MMVNERRVYDVIATSTSSSHRSWAAVVKSDLLKSQSQYVIFFRPSVNQNLTPHYLDPSFIFLFVSYPCKVGLGKLGLRTYGQKQGPWSPWRAKIGLTGLKRDFQKVNFDKRKGGGIVQTVPSGAPVEEWLILRKMLKEYLSLNIINNFHLYTKLFKIVSIGCLHSQCVVDPLQECGSF